MVEALPLKYLRLAGNPVVSKTPHYRKRLLANMPALNFLDDAPAFDKDVRMAKARGDTVAILHASPTLPAHRMAASSIDTIRAALYVLFTTNHTPPMCVISWVS